LLRDQKGVTKDTRVFGDQVGALFGKESKRGTWVPWWDTVWD